MGNEKLTESFESIKTFHPIYNESHENIKSQPSSKWPPFINDYYYIIRCDTH